MVQPDHWGQSGVDWVWRYGICARIHGYLLDSGENVRCFIHILEYPNVLLRSYIHSRSKNQAYHRLLEDRFWKDILVESNTTNLENVVASSDDRKKNVLCWSHYCKKKKKITIFNESRTDVTSNWKRDEWKSSDLDSMKSAMPRCWWEKKKWKMNVEQCAKILTLQPHPNPASGEWVSRAEKIGETKDEAHTTRLRSYT